MDEILLEVFTSMKSNKMRIALTGFAIGWGMFILILLLGAGNGILRGLTATFSNMSENVITLTPGTTALASQGHQNGRLIELTPDDIDFIEKQFPNVIKQTLPTIEQSIIATNVNYYLRSKVLGTKPNYMHTQTVKLVAGRDLSEIDIELQRKVCVIAQRTARNLFKANGEDILSKYVVLDGVPFQIVGIYEPEKSFITTQTVYIPLSTAATIWRPVVNYNNVMLTLDGLNSSKANREFINELTEKLSVRKEFLSADKRALSIDGNFDFYLMIQGVLGAIQIFIWIVGIATLIAGVVGISNIMLISVKERTSELGVRRAMGASNLSIIRLVLIESVVVTVIFGYVGMMVGIALTQLASFLIEKMTAGSDYNVIGSMTVDFSMLIAANLIMVIAGLIAGYAPARNAMKIKLIEALTS